MINIVLLTLLAVTALAIVRLVSLFAAIMLTGLYSLLSAGFFLTLDAVDVALTEAAVGAGITTVLLLIARARTGAEESEQHHGRWLPLLVVFATGAALIYATLDMPHFGDPQAPIQQHVKPRYIEDSPQEVDIPNVVTAVLASYRGFDTLGEVTVVFTAGIGALLLLGSGALGPDKDERIEDNPILREVVHLLTPAILLFALYVQFHGEYSPGGGFQAGVLFAAGIILYTIVYGLDRVQAVISPVLTRRLLAAGLSLYAGTGVVCMLLGRNFLDYDALAHDAVHGQHLGIFLVELGVGLTVAAVMLTLFYTFAAWRRT